MKLPRLEVTLPAPPRPVPPDPRWTFGGLQRAALREACPTVRPPVLRVVEQTEERP